MGEKYKKDIIIQGSTRILGGVFAFLSIFLITYLFNEEQIGVYNIVFATINLIVSITTLWITQSILRFYEDENDFIFTITVLSSILAIIVFTLSKFIIKFELCIDYYIYLIVLNIYYILDAVYRRTRKLYRYALLELIFSLGKMIPMVLIAYLTKDIKSIFMSQSILLTLFILIIFIKDKLYNNIRFNLNKKLLKEYLKYGIPLIGLSISSWILTSSDRYIIEYLYGSKEVGIYSTNYSLANSIYSMFSLILVNTFHPIIMKVWEKDKKDAVAITSNVIEKYIIFMYPLLFFGIFKSKVLLSVFKGSNYSTYSSIFICSSIGGCIYGLSLLYHKYFELIKKTKYIFAFSLISGICNIFLNILLVPKFGFEFAAFVTIISYLQYLIMIILSTRSKFKLKFPFAKFLIITFLNIVYYAISSFFVKSMRIEVFFIEGILYVLYILFMYKITNIFSFNLSFKIKRDLI